MTPNRGTLLPLALLVGVFLLFACNAEEENSPETCPDGEEVEYEGDGYCILIEEGFLTEDCPTSFPNGEAVSTVIVCSATPGLPDGLEAELERRGIIAPSGSEATSYSNVQRCFDGQDCLQTCEEGGCVSVCATGSRCTASCAGGTCVRACEPDSSCILTCLGGDCDFYCGEGADCLIDCAGGGCNTRAWDGSEETLPTQMSPQGFTVGTGDSLECAGTSECLSGCENGQCTFDCFDASRCTTSCSGGGCLFMCRDEAECVFTCAGGGCVFQTSSSNPITTTCGLSPCFYDYP